MKKLISITLLLVFVLSLAACAEKETQTPPVDLQTVMDAFGMQNMMLLDADTMLDFFGIAKEDYEQAIVAICADGLAADEVWLIRAKNTQALERLKTVADNRMQSKADETVDYLPDQYAIVQQGQVAVKGLYLALLVSPEAASMRAQWDEAVK